MRFHPTRGAMSLGESKGGLPPDCCVEEEPAALAAMKAAIETYHDKDGNASLHLHSELSVLLKLTFIFPKTTKPSKCCIKGELPLQPCLVSMKSKFQDWLILP